MTSIPVDPVPAAFLEWAVPPPQATSKWTWIALAISLVAMAGSSWFGHGINDQHRELPVYQQAFNLSVAGILAVGLLNQSGRSSPLSMLALPLALGTLGTALWQAFAGPKVLDDIPDVLLYRIEFSTYLNLLLQTILVGILVMDIFQNGPGKVIQSGGLLKALILAALLIGGVVIASTFESKPNVTFGTVSIPFRGP